MNNPDLESAVLVSLNELLCHYQELEKLADEILKQNNSDAAADDAVMDRFLAQRHSIQQLQSTSQSLHESYRQQNQHVSTAVGNLTSQILAIVQRVILKINEMEKNAQASRDQLMPHVTESVRGLQMKNAYAKYA